MVGVLADKSKFPTWAVAARIVFSFTPNSAACERVFSLLKFMFGDQQQWATLGDYIQAALMLSYNDSTSVRLAEPEPQFNHGASVTRALRFQNPPSHRAR